MDACLHLHSLHIRLAIAKRRMIGLDNFPGGIDFLHLFDRLWAAAVVVWVLFSGQGKVLLLLTSYSIRITLLDAKLCTMPQVVFVELLFWLLLWLVPLSIFPRPLRVSPRSLWVSIGPLRLSKARRPIVSPRHSFSANSLTVFPRHSLLAHSLRCCSCLFFQHLFTSLLQIPGMLFLALLPQPQFFCFFLFLL